MKVYLLIIFWLASFFRLSGQNYTDADFERSLDKGERLMEAGYYEEANEAFMFILDNKPVLPSELAYLFGRNSYHLGKYKQSINWLNKYIQLRGVQAKSYDEAVKYLEMAESSFREVQLAREKTKLEQQDTQENQDILTYNSDYDCGGLEKMICPVCKGSGVLIVTGTFQNRYKTCPYSKGEGYLSCEDYNLFMKGLLEPAID